MKKLFKILLLVNLLSIQILFANSASEDASDKATIYYEKQDYKEALKWSKKSFDEEASKEVAFNIGLAYKRLKDYQNAIKWYEKAFEMGNTDGGGLI
ncbi:tetratricopeptide repeat protein [Sulfurimonas sp.]|uniref:tetratricopeptide repeat protein n=1 Tax=Sulfurimonas sp. TaxID=2022749 RepID=UPI002B46B659|nr:tetratricopeptide repeat protein [Sulfurimonas sp.]